MNEPSQGERVCRFDVPEYHGILRVRVNITECVEETTAAAADERVVSRELSQPVSLLVSWSASRRSNERVRRVNEV